jgi:hypothetical protein
MPFSVSICQERRRSFIMVGELAQEIKKEQLTTIFFFGGMVRAL